MEESQVSPESARKERIASRRRERVASKLGKPLSTTYVPKGNKANPQRYQHLWPEVFAGNEEAVIKLSEDYLQMVEKIAGAMAHKLPGSIQPEDLITDGYIGLLDAIRKFDPSSGNMFETYATFRVRGEITSAVRDDDWVSRHSRKKFKTVYQTHDFLVQELGREPTWSEIADRMGVSVDSVLKTQASYNISLAASLDEIFSDAEAYPVKPMSKEVYLEDTTLGEVSFRLEEEAYRDSLLEALTALKKDHPTYSAILYIVHVMGSPLADVAEELEVSEGRVTSVYKNAVKSLKEYLLV